MKRGFDVIRDKELYRSIAFTREEREELGLTGLLPHAVAGQEQLVEQIASALPEDKRMLIVELADNHARHVWLQQEGAYHLGLAVGRRVRKLT